MFSARLGTNDESLDLIAKYRREIAPRDIGAAFIANLSSDSIDLRSVIGVTRSRCICRFIRSMTGGLREFNTRSAASTTWIPGQARTSSVLNVTNGMASGMTNRRKSHSISSDLSPSHASLIRSATFEYFVRYSNSSVRCR